MVNRYNMRMNSMGCTGEQSRIREVPGGSGCGCHLGNGESHNGSCVIDKDCKAMIRRLQVIDFAIVDTVLYLDAYPDCKKALNYYNKLICERDGLRSALSEKCKRPMSAFENKGADSWDWISSPWPWEASAN